MALKVLSLNVWGLHWLAKRVRERLCHIAEELQAYDIVGLQELWSQDDYLILVDKLKRSLPYSFRFISAIIGSGLCVFSRYPIISVNAQQFTTTGALRELWDGELFAGKGVLSCRIMTPNGPLLFVTTHTNPLCRDSQLFEVCQLISNTRGSDLVILCGDFNTSESHPAYGLITTYLGLQDVFAGCTACTCDLKSNIYTKKANPKRIDFIFYSSERCPTAEMEVQSKELSLSGNIPGKDFPYSDHEGLEAVFAIKDRATPLPPQDLLLGDDAVAVLEEVAQRIHNRKKKFEAHQPHCRALATGACLLLLLLFVSLLLGNNTVMTFLGAHSLGYLALIIMWLLGMGSLFVWLVPVFNIHHVNGMESHINEIRTRLSYNRMLADRQ